MVNATPHHEGPHQPGSGKTTLARAPPRLDAPAHDLDLLVYDERTEKERNEPQIAGRMGGREMDYRRSVQRRLDRDAARRRQPHRLARLPWRTCALRVLRRHLRAGLLRAKQHLRLAQASSFPVVHVAPARPHATRDATPGPTLRRQDAPLQDSARSLGDRVVPGWRRVWPGARRKGVSCSRPQDAR
jgi:hypothetical protein